MPALPDVRPLLINILSRYIIQCKLDGREGLPGQRSEEKWYPLLEGVFTVCIAYCVELE